ncbi:hypothetical protein HanPSC8_Chr16g0734771 [Helianthus annuus]|nr:hypothetical protein HanPSC8_Chr16g0734771 [Helianthus annuus]
MTATLLSSDFFSSVGTLWNREGPDAKALEESMETSSNLLHRFLLLSQGSMFGISCL